MGGITVALMSKHCLRWRSLARSSFQFPFMNLYTRDVEGLRRIFQSAFSVLDVAEPLLSFDAVTPIARIRKAMDSAEVDVVGIRKGGTVCGYAERGKLADAEALELEEFQNGQIITDNTSLVDVVVRLKDQPYVFVSVLGNLSGIVGRNEIQKPAGRMWLFGMVTLIEMRFGLLIERYCGDGRWQEFVSEGRLKKAKEIQAERQRRNLTVKLLDCLQLSDKLQIVARNPELRKRTRFESRKKMEQAIKAVEKLRNNLAHSQDLVSNDWDLIVALAENFEGVIAGPPGLREEPV